MLLDLFRQHSENVVQEKRFAVVAVGQAQDVRVGGTEEEVLDPAFPIQEDQFVRTVPVVDGADVLSQGEVPPFAPRPGRFRSHGLRIRPGRMR